MLESWQQAALDDATIAAQYVQRQHPEYPVALAPVSIAQFIIESDWGARHMDSANNYFGIKAKVDQPFTTRGTREFIGGRWVTVDAKFARFDSMQECFEAHAKLICEGTWHETGTLIYAAALSHPTDPVAFAHALTGLYATDPHYGDKLVKVMQENQLITPEGESNV